jgi:hypothetical protein
VYEAYLALFDSLGLISEQRPFMHFASGGNAIGVWLRMQHYSTCITFTWLFQCFLEIDFFCSDHLVYEAFLALFDSLELISKERPFMHFASAGDISSKKS